MISTFLQDFHGDRYDLDSTAGCFAPCHSITSISSSIDRDYGTVLLTHRSDSFYRYSPDRTKLIQLATIPLSKKVSFSKITDFSDLFSKNSKVSKIILIAGVLISAKYLFNLLRTTLYNEKESLSCGILCIKRSLEDSSPKRIFVVETRFWHLESLSSIRPPDEFRLLFLPVKIDLEVELIDLLPELQPQKLSQASRFEDL